MLSIFIRIQDYYFVWDEKFKHPVSHGMKKNELLEWLQVEERQDALDSFDNRIKRADETGSSSAYQNIDSLIKGNKAGKNNESLTKEQIFEEYGPFAEQNFKTIKPEQINNTIIIDDELNPSTSIKDKWMIGQGFCYFVIFFILISLGIFYLLEHTNYLSKLSFMNKEVISLCKNILLCFNFLILGIFISPGMSIWKRKIK